MERICPPLVHYQSVRAVVPRVNRIGTGHPNIQRRQATRNGRRSKYISRAKRRMRGNQTQGFNLGSGIARGGRGMQLVTHRVVANNAVGTTQGVGSG